MLFLLSASQGAQLTARLSRVGGGRQLGCSHPSSPTSWTPGLPGTRACQQRRWLRPRLPEPGCPMPCPRSGKEKKRTQDGGVCCSGRGPGTDLGVNFSCSESVAAVSEPSGWLSGPGRATHGWAGRGRGGGLLTFPSRPGRGRQATISREDPTGHVGSLGARCPGRQSRGPPTPQLPGAGAVVYSGRPTLLRLPARPPRRHGLHPHGSPLCSQGLSFPAHGGGRPGSRKQRQKMESGFDIESPTPTTVPSTTTLGFRGN